VQDFFLSRLERNIMDRKTLANLRARTDAKLRYAEIHLDELRTLGTASGKDFDRAHQESFLYHLLGAKDAFLLELNEYYGCGLPQEELTAGKLRAELKKQGKNSKELAEIYKLENNHNEWLFHVKEMRNYSTHISGVPRVFFCGGPEDGQIWLKNPKTGQDVKQHFVDKFDNWLANTRELLERLRASAITTNSP